MNKNKLDETLIWMIMDHVLLVDNNMWVTHCSRNWWVQLRVILWELFLLHQLPSELWKTISLPCIILYQEIHTLCFVVLGNLFKLWFDELYKFGNWFCGWWIIFESRRWQTCYPCEATAMSISICVYGYILQCNISFLGHKIADYIFVPLVFIKLIVLVIKQILPVSSL